MLGRGGGPGASGDGEAVRACLRAAHEAAKAAQAVLSIVQPAAVVTSRAGYLRSLYDQIGPPPTSRTWEDEWVPLRMEFLRLSGQADGGLML